MPNTALLDLTPEEKAYFDQKFKLRSVEATDLIGQIFKGAQDPQKKPAHFTASTNAAIKGALIGILAFLEARMDILVRRQRNLLDRIDQLENRNLRYYGAWQKAMSYPRGAVCTHQGSAWIAVRASDAPIPGPDWQLLVKSGREG